MCNDHEIIYSGKLVTVGVFNRQPDHPEFKATKPMGYPLIVFPRTCVRITHAGKEPVVTDPNVVMFYNAGQEYRRDKLSERGDFCEWFLFDLQVLEEAIKPYSPHPRKDPNRPFSWTHGPSDPSSYLLQRKVVEHIQSRAEPDPLFVEESLLDVLDKILENAYHARNGDTAKSSNRRTNQVAITNAVKSLLATRFRENLSLDQIAQEVNYSPYHLSRVFRRQTGFTIHQYLNQIRLRTALEYLCQDNSDLTRLALTLGYSSHSHFTQAFRRNFGAPPSEVRHKRTLTQLSELRKILIA
jgi:AraC family transcriptional regulator